MTAADPDRRLDGGRKIRWLAIGIVLFLIVYTGGWFLAAHHIQSRVQTFLTDTTSNGGASVECDHMDVRGFPFRIGVFCNAVRLDDTALAASASFGALRSAAQVYAPGHAVMELDGPTEIRFSPGLSVSANWSLMQASVQASFSGLSGTSLAYNKLTGTAVVPDMDEEALPGETHRLAFQANHGEAHLRQNGEDLDAALSVDAFSLGIDDTPGILPPITSSVDLTLHDRAGVMDRGGLQPGAFRNSKGKIHNLLVDLGGGMVTTASGPFKIDERGLISGEFHVTMKNIEGWRQALVKVFPERNDTIMVDNIANMLTALANGKNEATVKLNVRDGIAFLAFFPIGELPRL